MARDLQQAGVRLKAYACDVSNFEQLDQTLKLCAQEMPPIRGVIQSSMVLRVSLPPIVPYWKKTMLADTEKDYYLTNDRIPSSTT